MRRINDARNTKKSQVPRSVRNEVSNTIQEEIRTFHLNTDIFYILQFYDSRIYFPRKTCYKNAMEKYKIYNYTYDSKLPFDVNMEFYINLKNLLVKNCDLFSFEYINNKQLKVLELKNVKKLSTFYMNEVSIEEIILKNINLELNEFLKILQIKNLQAISLRNVHIKEKKYNTEHTYAYVSSDSEEFINDIQDVEISDQEYTNNNDMLNSAIGNKLDEVSLKKISLYSTNIKLETIVESRCFRDLTVFRYYTKSKYMFLSYNRNNYLKINFFTPLIFDDVESLSVNTSEWLYNSSQMSKLKALCLSNSNLSNEIINTLIERCHNLTEASFINCLFSDLSFYKFLDYFGDKLVYLNLTDSTLPMDALHSLKRRLKDCKVVFRDKSIFKLSTQ